MTDLPRHLIIRLDTNVCEGAALSIREVNLELTKPHFSCKVYRAYLTYLKKNYPRINLESLCEEAGLSLPYLEDESNFVSVIFDDKFTRLAIEKTGEKDLCFKVGAQSMTADVMGAFVFFLVKNTISVRQIYAQIPKLTEFYSKVTRPEIVELTSGFAVIRLHALPSQLDSEERKVLRKSFSQIFQNTLGHYAAIPSAQDLPPAQIDYAQLDGTNEFPIYEMRIRFESVSPLRNLLLVSSAFVATTALTWMGVNLLDSHRALTSIGIGLGSTGLWVLVGLIHFKQLRQRFDQAIRSAQSADQRYSALMSAQTELKSLSDSYKKFVPREFIDLFDLKNFSDLRLGQSLEREMTIMFVDIRKFTQLAERMTSPEILVFLNSFFAALAPIIRDQDGFIDKYIGDGLMAIFPNRSADAIYAALKIESALNEFNADRKNRGQPEIQIGMGIHSGKVTLGTIGYKDQMQNTVLSDVVNIASRLETETKYIGARIIVSEKALEESKLKNVVGNRLLGKISLRGKENAVVAYEIYEGRVVTFKSDVEDSKADFEYAVKLLDSGEIEKAHKIFEALHLKFQNDPVIDYYRSRSLPKKQA